MEDYVRNILNSKKNHYNTLVSIKLKTLTTKEIYLIYKLFKNNKIYPKVSDKIAYIYSFYFSDKIFENNDEKTKQKYLSKIISYLPKKKDNELENIEYLGIKYRYYWCLNSLNEERDTKILNFLSQYQIRNILIGDLKELYYSFILGNNYLNVNDNYFKKCFYKIINIIIKRNNHNVIHFVFDNFIELCLSVNETGDKIREKIDKNFIDNKIKELITDFNFDFDCLDCLYIFIYIKYYLNDKVDDDLLKYIKLYLTKFNNFKAFNGNVKDFEKYKIIIKLAPTKIIFKHNKKLFKDILYNSKEEFLKIYMKEIYLDKNKEKNIIKCLLYLNRVKNIELVEEVNFLDGNLYCL